MLGTAVAGLLVALRARRPVSEIALVTAAPWWVTGVVTGAMGLTLTVDGIAAAVTPR